MSNLAKVYLKDPNIVARKIAGEIILVPIKQNAGDLSSIYTLNGVGARIWELIDGTMSIEDIINSIVAGYEVTPEQAEADIVEFITKLQRINLLSTTCAASVGL
jgi:hypothetical protein